MARLLGRLPAGFSNRLARHAVPVTVGLVGLLLLAGVATAALVSPGALGITAARLSETTQLPETLTGSGLAEKDSDLDGVSDSLENYVYGTDPNNWNSSGLGIPDGWLAEFGFDPLSLVTRTARGAAPPADQLPAAYKDGYPQAFRPSLGDYYLYAKPSDYVPGQSAPWWRQGEHASPRDWDQTGSGIPTGWIVHYGLPLSELEPDKVAPGSEGNLTIRQAYEHNTNPLKRDSDDDGVDDWMEIHVTKTDPSRFSTARTSIADGWLLHYGLDALNPDVATQDPDRDGLTNLEEFVMSYETFRADVERDGLPILFTRGLDPLEWQTAFTGIPDGWYVKYGLSPFGADVDRVIGKASDFPEYRAWTPEGFEELPDFVFTVRSAYEYARPSEWNESTDGVWWGGTNPVTLDSDGDGLPDPVEIRGWYANVTFDTGLEAKARIYLATGNPLEGDSDGDGLNDLEEYRGFTTCGRDEGRSFPPTDPRNRDTAFSGLTDFEKVCGVVRGQASYDLSRQSDDQKTFLDPTRADSAGDHMRDGARVDYWHERYDSLRKDPKYPYDGSLFSTVFDWTDKYSRFGGLSREQVLEQFRPDGDADGDGLPNVLDADPSGGLYAEKFADPGTPRDKVFFLGGPQMDPSLYRLTEFNSVVPHASTDPANPDTDGDGLPDSWETRYGRFDPVLNGWDLDPTKGDSDGDGTPDDEANNDGDSVTWYAYNKRGSSTERVTNVFAFNNRLEFVAGTNPNEVSSAGDGVPDGWKVFWGSRITDGTFPNLIGGRDPSVGTVALAAADDIDAALATSPIQPLANLNGLGGKSTGYVRLVNVTACLPPTQMQDLLREDEEFAQNACYSGRNLEGKEVAIARIKGLHTLTYADEARLRTNPFLADSDGDGAPDAYEAYYLVRTAGGSVFPDPSAPDASKDPDLDGIGLADECASPDGGRRCGADSLSRDGITHGIGADPNSIDTDNDGIQDGIEYNAGLNLVDPSDVESFSDPTRDTDGDAVPDYQELTGWGKVEFGVPVRTDPQDPDSDADGLLDGQTLTFEPGRDDARIDRLRALGLAHRVLANGSFDFLGERTFGASFGLNPETMFSVDDEVPDAWLAYYSQNPRERTIDRDAYSAHRPEWWDESIHGVWWWGTPAGSVATANADLDGDGLNDRNGEDPFPATNRFNRIVDGGTIITDPRDVEDFVNAAGSLEAVRIRAQKLGEGAGNPEAARSAATSAVNPVTGVPVRQDRACVEILDLASPADVRKGEAFTVTGRVVFADCEGAPARESLGDRVGVANRTVLVSFFEPSRDLVVGAGFTDAEGRFNLSANITSDHRFPIPAPGLTLLGAVDGVAVHTFDSSRVSPGNTTAGRTNALVAWVTNTSWDAQPGAPTHFPREAWLPDASGAYALRVTNATGFAVSSSLPVSVTATTSLSTTLAPDAVNGKTLVGDVKLQDASGAPIANKLVVVKWTGSTSTVEFRNLTTDRNGNVNLTRLGIPVAVSSPDQYALSATFTSTDPNLVGAKATFPVRVRHPTTLTVETDAVSATVGESITLTGTVVTLPVSLPDGTTVATEPVPEATLRVRLGGLDETTRTDTLGRFSLRITVPGSILSGTQNIEVDFAGDDDHDGASGKSPLTIKRTAALVELGRIEGSRTGDVGLRGRLVDNEGQGFAGPVEVHHNLAGRVAAGRAGDDGRFVVPVPLRALPLGAQTLKVVFPGDSGHASAENFTQARVTSASALRIDEVPEEVVRGESFRVTARLEDDRGEPVARQPVSVYWQGDRLVTLVTDDQGIVSHVVDVNRTERPASLTVAFEYVPPTNAVFQTATSSAAVRVLAGTTLELEDRTVHRGSITITGRLIDDDGRPLAGSPVTVHLADQSFGVIRTARNGTFEATRTLAQDFPLGPATVTARYPGTATLAGDNATATWRVTSPLALDLVKVGAFVRGEDTAIEATLKDDAGRPVAAVLNATLGTRDLGPITFTDGRASMLLSVPSDIERGENTLRLHAAASERYDAFASEFTVLIKIRPAVEVELPALAVRGFAFGGEVRLYDDQGEPLRNTSFVYVLGDGRGAVAGQTDAAGQATLASVAPLSGEAVLGLTVRGGPDVLPTEYSTSSLRVIGPATPIGYAGLILGVVAVLLVVGAVMAVALLRRRQLTEARDIIEEAIHDLLAGNEYAGTIFLCYRRFAAHLARHGFAEKASETPREFALGVRKALPIGAVPLRSFIQVFEEARYSDHSIGSAERDDAVENLAAVRNELDRLLGKKGVTPA